MSVIDEAKKLGFNYCKECGLVWCDGMGAGESYCPRCSRVDESTELHDKISSLERTIANLRGRIDELGRRLGKDHDPWIHQRTPKKPEWMG